MRRWIAVAGIGLLATAGSGVHGAAQADWTRGGEGWCDEQWASSDRDRFCEVRTASVEAPARIEVDGGMNGGVSVVGWDRSTVGVEARVWANAGSESRAEELVGQVRISVVGGRISADGPQTGRRENWGVSYYVQVPRSMDLDLRTHNGGISVEEVSGDIRFDAVNGGVDLASVGGDVRGETTNGGLRIELDGDRWAGAGLDVETTNGGVRLMVPEGYSADLITGTVNGGFDIDFPITVQGRIGRRLETTLGAGGPTIRATTTNGGVKIERRSVLR